MSLELLEGLLREHLRPGVDALALPGRALVLLPGAFPWGEDGAAIAVADLSRVLRGSQWRARDARSAFMQGESNLVLLHLTEDHDGSVSASYCRPTGDGAASRPLWLTETHRTGCPSVTTTLVALTTSHRLHRLHDQASQHPLLPPLPRKT